MGFRTDHRKANACLIHKLKLSIIKFFTNVGQRSSVKLYLRANFAEPFIVPKAALINNKYATL